MMTRESGTVYRFASYEADASRLELRKSGVRVRLTGKPLEALLLLVERPGEIVTREQFRERLWGSDTFVDFEDSLNHAIRRLREALEDDPKNPRFIETVAGTGYRFVAHVDQAAAEPFTERPTGPARRKWLPVAAAACVAAALVWLWLREPAPAEPVSTAEAAIPSIAVLPFANLSGLPEDQVFGDGVADALINELAKIRSLRMISRTSTLRYRNPSMGLPEIARELGATHVIEGTALRQGDKVRIIAQLVDGATDEHLWTEDYEESADEILAFQNRVARKVAAAISAEVTPEEEARLAAARPVRPEVYAIYLEARAAFERAALSQAVELFEETIRQDPDYAPAYSWLADAYLSYGYWLAKPETILEKAQTVALRSRKLDETLAEPYVLLGRISAYRDWDWRNAERHFVRALELNPSHVRGILAYARYLVVVGRPEEATRRVDEALKIDPFSVSTLRSAAAILHAARSLDRALELLETATALAPDGPKYRGPIGCIYGSKGDFERALEYLEQVRDYSNGDVRPLALRVWANAKSGRLDNARRVAQLLEEELTRHHTSHFATMIAYAALGDMDQAYAVVDQAVESRWLFLPAALTLPPYDVLRADARFERLLDRMGLRELWERNSNG